MVEPEALVEAAYAGAMVRDCLEEGTAYENVLYLLAAIGAIALIAILGMFFMHGTMMSGMM